MRRFFRHVAPRLCGSEGETGARSGPGPTAGGNSGHHLYGPRKSKNSRSHQYEKFGDSNELYAIRGRSRMARGEQAMTVEVTGRGSGDNDGDDDRSDKAIMENSQIVQTKTVTVQYE